MSERPTRPAVIGISFAQPPASGPRLNGAGDLRPQPYGPVEQAMLEIWQQVLAVEVVNLEADFFEAGGDSITATQVVARARHVFGVELALPDLFANPTLRGMAERVEAALSGPHSARRRPYPYHRSLAPTATLRSPCRCPSHRSACGSLIS